MSMAEHIPQPLAAAMEQQRQTLAGLIRKHTRSTPEGEGYHACAVPGLQLVRYEHCRPSASTLAEPALCVFAHGSKEVCLGDERYVYDPLHFLVLSVAMPVSGRLLNASPEDPSLLIRLDIDPAEINQL
ncbi:AraC family transcriptional regulator, partial [Pseudomonas typographi]|uniref:AraC family transcriptional regulator n=1 Tax=Pseudomonas typographi TaxID=2715964 RepID=UPI0016844202